MTSWQFFISYRLLFDCLRLMRKRNVECIGDIGKKCTCQLQLTHVAQGKEFYYVASLCHKEMLSS